MPLRLIETVMAGQDSAALLDLLKEHEVLEHRQVQLADDQMLVRILVEAEQSESVLDLLEQRFADAPGNRVVVLPVEATLPRALPEQAPPPNDKPARVSREELVEDIRGAAECTRVYLVMVLLSTIVAIVGVENGNVAVIIGAMVIAPLLGPSVALALGTTLGDLSLLWRAFRTTLAGVAVVAVLSVIAGAVTPVDASAPELAARTHVAVGEVAVALASGCAGALAFTTGVSVALIGVMVAVALLPPLAVSGLLLGSGQPGAALGALSLFLVNLICVNLAGVTTFVVQGIHPVSWWEKGRATKATRIAIAISAALLAVLIGMILLFQTRR